MTRSPATVADPVITPLIRFGECFPRKPSKGDNGDAAVGGAGGGIVGRVNELTMAGDVVDEDINGSRGSSIDADDIVTEADDNGDGDDDPSTLLLLRFTRRTFFPSARI